MATKNQLQNVPPGMYHDLKIARWKARTDLGFLCREILNYPDVSTDEGGPWHALHQPLIDRLQRFPVPSQQQFDTYDRLEHGKWVYKSLVPILDLEGKKRRLILDSRSFLKTTINCIAHSIQWILNYPNISILLLMGSGDRASAVLDEIKNHFKYNPRFRQLFPEHCPQKNIEELTDLALDLMAKVRDLRYFFVVLNVPDSSFQVHDAVAQIRTIVSQIEGCLATFKDQK